MIDQQRVREDTPGTLNKHFLDSAGSSLPPNIVVDTVVNHLRREADIGGYKAASERLPDLARVKTSIGNLIGADASNIALSDSATRSWSDFFYAVPLKTGDRILITEVEYAGNAIAAMQRAQLTDATVEIIPSDDTGQVDLVALEAMLDDRVAVISLVHAPTSGGLVNPVREVVDLAHRVGALVLLDACQSVGQLRIDVTELGVDGLSATGRKWLRGPRGTGFLYLSASAMSVLTPRSLDLRGAEWTGLGTYAMAADASRFEFWECDVAARLGLGAAVDYLLEIGIDNAAQAIGERAEYLRTELRAISGVHVHDLGKAQSGIVTFTVDGVAPEDVRDRLALADVTVTVSFRGSTRVDMTRRGLDAVVRASPHYFVSFDDLDALIKGVRHLV